MEPPLTIRKEEISTLLDEAYKLRVHNIQKSISLTEKAYDLGKEAGNKQLIGRSLSLLALFHMIVGDFDLSVNIANQSIEYFQEMNEEKGIADAKYTIAGAYYKRDDFYKGLTYLLDCHTIYSKYGDYHNLGRVQKSMGTIYEYLGDIESASEIYLQAVESGRKAEDLNIQSNAFNPLSGIYLNKGEHEKAMDIIELSIKMKNESGDIRGLGFALYGRGKIYTKASKFDLAEKDFKESIRIHEQMGEKVGWAMSHHKLGALYLEMGELEKAEKMLVEALAYSNKNRIILIKFKSNLLLHEVSKRKGDYEMALKYLTQYLEEKESVLNTRTAKVIDGYAAISKMQSLEREAKAQKEKANIIEKKNIELDSFFYRISHDLKGPINSMISLNYIVKHEIEDEKALKFFNEFEVQSTRLNNILDELLRLTKISYANDRKEKIDFGKLIDGCINSYKYLENFNKINFDVNVETFDFEAEWSLINSIIQNLVENGIKYARPENNQPKIAINVHRLKDEIVIVTKDNGIGMSEEDAQKIFAMFFRANRKIEGTGLGLHILKRAVERLNGRVKVTSQLGKGSTFTVWLPA